MDISSCPAPAKICIRTGSRATKAIVPEGKRLGLAVGCTDKRAEAAVGFLALWIPE
jgi:hypothetical protein